MVKHENQNLKNPNTTGVILVETAINCWKAKRY